MLVNVLHVFSLFLEKKIRFSLENQPPPPKKNINRSTDLSAPPPLKVFFRVDCFFYLTFTESFFLNEYFRDQANLEPILATQ